MTEKEKDKEQRYFKCRKCETELPMTSEYFSRNKNRKTGYSIQCKSCAKKYMDAYREKNREKARKESLEYYYQNKEERQAYNKRWAEKNKEHRQEYMKKWKKDNAEHLSNYMVEYNLNNRDKINEYEREYYRKNRYRFVIKDQKRKSMLLELPHDLTEEEWEDTLEYFDNGCAYCGDSESGLAQDHVIPISKGGPYTQENIIPACKSCNSSKKDRDLEEWYVKYRHYDEERLNKILDYVEIVKGDVNYDREEREGMV